MTTSWVLLRGLTRDRGHWGTFPDRLRQQLPAGARVVTLDLPGNGTAHRLASPTRIAATTAWCRARLREEHGIAAPVVLLAMSMGAMVAIDWASAAPHELAGCVLVNTSVRPVSPWHWRLRPANYGSLLHLALLARDAATRERTILRLTSARAAQHEADVIAAWTRLRHAHPVTRANALRQLVAAARYRAPASAPRVPVLLLAGARDSLVDARCSQRLAACWNVPLALHPWAGHDLPLDDAPWVIAQAGAFARAHALA